MMNPSAVLRLRRVLAAGPIGALIGVGLAVVPVTTVQAQTVRHTKAAEVSGSLERSEDRVLPFETRHAGIYWAGNPDAKVTVSFSRDAVTFGEAFELEHDEVGMQRENGLTYAAIVPAGDATVARITTDRPLGRLTVVAMTDGGTSIQRTPVPGRPAGSAGNVVSRGEWGADESLRFKGPNAVWPPVFQTVQKLVVHHTAGANGESGDAARATIRSIYYYHAVTQGYGDIGYNFLIDAAGVVYKGRSTTAAKVDNGDLSGENGELQGVTAGHAYGYNSGSVGVAMLGTYTTAAQQATTATKDALRNFLVTKAKAHGLDTAFLGMYTNPVNGTQAKFENLPGHREVPNNDTACPGTDFQVNVLAQMRDDIRLAAGPADTVAPSDPPSVTPTLNRRTVVLNWERSIGDTGKVGGGISGVAGYDVWRGVSGSLPGTWTRLGSTTGLTLTDSSRAAGVAYDYYVETYDGAGNRGPGNGTKTAKAI